jgi:dTDP-glucose 4,6-dehydratase
MSKTKLLVTGSGGFIFSNFVRYVLKNSKSYEIVSIDKCLLPQTINTLYSNKSHKFYIGDIADKHFVNTIFEIERPDFVINGAASSFVDDAIKDATDFIYNNIMGTQVIIDACLKWKVNKLLQISTDETLGQLTDENAPSWTEDAPLNPRNAYSASKASAELLVRAASETHGLKYNITRSCNNYGPRQPRRNLIPVIIANIIEKKPVPIYGQGMQIRDWIHVQDNCSAILKVLESAPDNETYNISAKQEFTNIEVFHEITKAMGQGYDLLTFVEDRKGHDFRYSIDNKKILELGWKPEWKFKSEGIQHTVDWMTANYWWLENKGK